MNKIIIFLIFIPLISALQITEVELNPEGGDKGGEWIEFYSEKEVNLSNYKIINNDQDEIHLNQSFKGYLIYEFENQWLDNSDEKISIYKNSELIYETPILEDIKNNQKTHSLCNDNWLFQTQTKGKENCKIDNYESKSSTNDKSEKISNPKIKNFNKKQKSILQETIYLNPQTIKTKNTTKNKEEKEYAKYSIIVFCVVLSLLYLSKSKKRKKNEWQ